MSVQIPYNQNSCFKDRHITPNNLFNQIETDLRLITEKCTKQIQKTNLVHEKIMYNQVLDHINQMIQNNSEKHILFKQNHFQINDNYKQQQTNSKLDVQMSYFVTFVFQFETKEEEFTHQLSFKQLYLFLLKEYSVIIKSMFVILDQQENIINPDDWDQPFLCGNKAQSLFIIQSLSQYLMPQKSQIAPRESQTSAQSQKTSEVFSLFKSCNPIFQDVKKESRLYQSHSTIQKYNSLMNSIAYRCKYCNQEIQNQQIMLKCYHNYHEDCLTSMLKSQIQSGQPILNCLCNYKIHINELDLLTNYLKENLFNNQIDTIYQRQQGQFIKCKNCKFFYMKTQNKSQIRSACIMCST
ncbi:unnamed protein product [Paramecium octaurelia]|uniref:Zinc finger C3HC4 RING-type domain-containing protein n=1 Tax=Paramecium octaurelia TaxID=43137 RepID=A0A8S1VD38_PAROT|nr:unnamed protein product [Paramecium octaurelia]